MAGWEVGEVPGSATFDPPVFGIKHVLAKAVDNEEQFRKKTSVLKRAFNAAGMNPDMVSFSELNPSSGEDLRLYIG